MPGNARHVGLSKSDHPTTQIIKDPCEKNDFGPGLIVALSLRARGLHKQFFFLKKVADWKKLPDFFFGVGCNLV